MTTVIRGRDVGVAQAPAAKRSPGPRERMVLAATELMRRQGVHGTGLREVVERANAPRGSLQHYFPGGKEQLIGEAIAAAGAFASGRIRRYAEANPGVAPSELFAAMVSWWRNLYLERGFDDGCPLAAATADTAARNTVLRDALHKSFDAWQRSLEGSLKAAGVPDERCAPLAMLMMTSLEGALIIARSNEDVGPLDTIVSELQPLLDSAVHRPRRTLGS